ncbi:MAG: PepSY domain-containing protein [Alphaproteobacteria bacterium]|nr:PepSY domain-containing protein [Alphaproteobacteria bacterium]
MVFLVAPARAQENVIRVIGDDGSVQEIELPIKENKAVQRLPEEPKPQPRQAAPAPQPQTPPEPTLPPIPALPELRPQMPQELKAIVTPKPAPVMEKQEEAAPPVAEPPAASAPQQETVEWQQDERAGIAMITPSRKPPVPAVFTQPKPAPLSPVASPQASPAPAKISTPVKPSGPLTKEQAVAIAMEKAPPARRVMAVPAVHNGRSVYAVTFSTESGPVNIMVDSNTGDIVQ